MEIQKVVLHLLKKERNQDSELQVKDSVLTHNTPVTKLVESIIKTYDSKTGKSFGKFDEDEDNFPFITYVRGYFQPPRGDFLPFTKLAMKTLKKEIDQQNLATGGYILFVTYKLDGKLYLLIVMLNDTTGIKVTNALTIEEEQHLDLSKLHLGGRICVTDWDDGSDDKYISFIKGKVDGVSQYFRNFLGCAEYIDATDETKNFVVTVKAFCKSRGYDKETTEATKQKAHDYCKEKAKKGKPVDLELLSKFLVEDEPEAFLEFANSEEYKLAGEFYAVPKVLQKLVKYSGKGKGIAISFDSDLFGERIHYNKENDVLTIQGIPDDLKKQLMEYAS